jgi:alpha-D-ribose 1-methylphosphonate 5-triphosphate diphosphatase
METIYTNATIITRNETVHGTLVVKGETIKDVDSSIFRGCGAVDLEGEMLLPGLIEIHTEFPNLSLEVLFVSQQA